MPALNIRTLCLVTVLQFSLAGFVGTAPGALPGPAVVEDRALPVAGFAIETFQTDEGLPQNSINAIVQARNGYLWMGTYNGLVRFDGVRFKVFDASSSPNLPDNRITSLFEGTDGVLWLGHETGEVTTYRDGVLEPVDLGFGRPKGSVVGISEDAAGDIWVLDDQGNVTRVADHAVLPPLSVTETAPAGVPSMCRQAGGKVWVTYRGVVGVPALGGLIPVAFDDPGGTPYIVKLCPARDGAFWVITSTRLRKWRDGEWLSDLGPCPWADSFVTSTMETRDGRLVVGTLDQGLYIVGSAPPVSHLSRANGLPHERVSSLCEDHEGNLWVGTGGGGLAVLRKARVVMANPPDDWLGRGVLSVTPGHDGALWAGTEGAGLYRLHDGEWTHYGAAEGLQNPFVWSVLDDRQGILRVGTWGEGLFLKRKSGFVVAPGWERLQIPVTSMYQSADNTIWAGTGRGLLTLQGTNLSWVYGGQRTRLTDVRTILEDADNTIWFGTMGQGLGRVGDGEVRLFTTVDGLASDFILSICADADGTLWIGTKENGLSCLRDGSFRTINVDSGLANNVIGAIADDGLGHLWLSSQQGILRVSKEEMRRYADGKSSSVSCLVYGKRQGLATLACSAGFSPSWCRTTGGRLVFPTARGVAVVNPRDVEPNRLPPSVEIEEVAIQGTAVEPAKTRRRESGTGPAAQSPTASPGTASLEMAPDERRIEIHYTALSFVAPEKVRFRYKLAPLEQEWVEAGTRRSANYSFVPPGNYTFKVVACNNDGVWNLEGAELHIRVLPQFWETWWFRSVLGCLAMAAVVGLVILDSRRRLHRKLERLERERAVERERSRIAQDIHDDLGASLTQILMLTQDGGDGAEEEEFIPDNIRQVHATARELTRAMDEIVWAVNPRHDTLESLVNYLCRYAQSFLSSAQLRCRLDVPLNLPELTVRADVRHNLFLAVKEALNNIVKHADAGEVRLSIHLVPEELQLELRDDGRGLVEGAKSEVGPEPKDPGRLSSGLGFENMRRRLVQLGGSCEVTSVHGQGTCLRFRLPLEAMSVHKASSPPA